MTGPNNAPTFAVPRDCMKNSPTMITTAKGSTNGVKWLLTTFSPSTAESTDMAGVIIESP